MHKKTFILMPIIFLFLLSIPSFGFNGAYDGIYKDVGGSNNLNVYIQSYDNGGTLLIYTFDPNVSTMAVFWDNAVENNIFVGSSVNTSLHEQVTFDFYTNIITITNLDTSASNSYSTYKFSDLGDFIPTFDGIYKDASNDLDVYIQSYNNGGTLLLYTFDRVNMYVFWDPNVENNLFDGDPVNSSLPLRAQFDFSTDTLTIFDIPSGTSTSYSTAIFAAPGGLIAQLQARLNLGMQYICTKDINNFMNLIDPTYMDNGEDYSEFQQDMQAFMSVITCGNPARFVVERAQSSGDLAEAMVKEEIVNLTPSEAAPAELCERIKTFFKNSGGSWLIYGNQEQFEAKVSTSWSSSWSGLYFMISNEYDKLGNISSVTVSGPNVTNFPLELTDTEEKEWSGFFPIDLSLISIGDTYTFTIVTDSGTITKSVAITSKLATLPTPVSPAPGATGVSTTPTFSWNLITGAENYEITISTTPSEDGIFSEELITFKNQIQYLGPTLSSGTTYYWQIRAYNDSSTAFSDWNSFTTQ